ncbi:hypothetical protein OCK74_13470 [Chitinophagaceae bacterium LB-8]|uniref:Tetratricopeptide repeat protein n=1 Tax=Paraflavisolibacter caeni TaxID=2982496 RepID=A0A9X2XX29_9BACT|nr:hypothetical protein [Paraflavisolibacter caeni]MCU7550127.1 hypothetical protein [Paraflavisolibacter caeni]
MVNAWDKILVDDFEDGYRMADATYSQSLKHYDLRARAISSFLLRNYETALSDFLRLKQDEQASNMPSDGTYLDIGLCYYAIGDIMSAIEHFVFPVANRKLIKYTSDITVPASILFYVGLRTQRQDLQKVATKELKRFMQVVPQFILGRAAEDDLDKLYKEQTHPVLQNRKQCKTEFYKAVKALQTSDSDKYQEHLKRCVALKGNYLEFEYYMARVELDKLNSR